MPAKVKENGSVADPVSKEVGFSRRYDTAVALAASVKTVVVKTAQDFQAANDKLKSIRDLEKELEEEYSSHPVIVEAKRMRTIKGELADMLEAARKSLKNGPMLKYEQVQEQLRQAEERKLAEIARKKQEEETAARVAEQKRAWEQAEKERKVAEAKAAKEKDAAKRAQAEQAAKDAAAQSAAAVVEAQAIKADAAAAPAPIVVVEKTAPSVTRRMVPKFRVVNESLVPRQYLSVDEVRIGGVVRSLRANHGIPGIEYYEVPA